MDAVRGVPFLHGRSRRGQAVGRHPPALVASIGGHREEWDAEITEQTPDQRIAWKAITGKGNAGVVTFHRLDDDRTKIMLQLDWESEGMVEALGAMEPAGDPITLAP